MRIRLFALTLLALSLLSTTDLLHPTLSQAATCSCIPNVFSTSSLEVGGSTCAAASNKLAALTHNEAQASCAPDGLCYESAVIVDVPCYDAGGGLKKKKGHRDFRCQVCN